MICKMDNSHNECRCGDIPVSGEVQLSSMDPGCCKTEIKEINNTNTLELNKISLIKDISFKTIHFPSESELRSYTSFITNIHSAHLKPPADIPILFSHILI